MNVSEILYKASYIVDAIECSSTDDKKNGEATLVSATVNFNFDNEPYRLYIGGSGSVTIHNYNDEIEVPF